MSRLNLFVHCVCVADGGGHGKFGTVESRKFDVLGTRGFTLKYRKL